VYPGLFRSKRPEEQYIIFRQCSSTTNFCIRSFSAKLLLSTCRKACAAGRNTNIPSHRIIIKRLMLPNKRSDERSAVPNKPVQIIFDPDAASELRLPSIESTSAFRKAFILMISDSNLEEQFGSPGATGRATIKVSRYSYSSVYAKKNHMTDQELIACLLSFPTKNIDNNKEPEPSVIFGCF
jgi:hypothetical protein